MEWNKKPGVRTTPEEFNKRAKYFGFDILSEYKNNKTKVLAKCLSCGFENMVKPDNILFGKKCRQCAFKSTHEKQRLTQEEFEKRVKEKTGDLYTVLGEYIGADNKILIKHNECGYEYNTTPNKFYHSGRRCPNCYNSNPEKEIKGLLIAKGIEFVEQYKFDDCRNIFPLRFDFKISVDNKWFLLEYQGSQHYIPSDLFGKDNFKQTQINDKIKYDYCRNNYINLEYITYKENIEEKLNQILEFYANHAPS